jgi:hypothetical protein
MNPYYSDLLHRISHNQTIWRVRTEIHLCPKVKYSFHCADFHENHNGSLKMHKDVPHQILNKSDKTCRQYRSNSIYVHMLSIFFFTGTDIHETATLHGNLLCWTLYKSEEKCRTMGKTSFMPSASLAQYHFHRTNKC